VSVGLYGFSATDFQDFAVIADDLAAVHPDARRQFLHSSPFTFVLGAPLLKAGVDVLAAFIIVHAAGLGLLAATFARFIRGHGPDGQSVAYAVLASPVVIVVLHWFGKRSLSLRVPSAPADRRPVAPRQGGARRRDRYATATSRW